MTLPTSSNTNEEIFNMMTDAFAVLEEGAKIAIERVQTTYGDPSSKLDWVVWLSGQTTALHTAWGNFATNTTELATYMGSK